MTKELKQYMQQNLRAVQMKELSILCTVTDICKSNGIEYWLDGGTLLGAKRHGGFIPWDDDIDIAIRKEDTKRFTEAMKRELPENLFLQIPETDPSYNLPIIKIRDRNSLIVEFGDNFKLPYKKGLYVDVFPMLPHPTMSRKALHTITRGYCRSNAILNALHRYSWRSVAELFWFGTKRILFSTLWYLSNIFLSKNKFMGNTIEDNGYGITHLNETVFPLTTISFEGETFKAPANPDAYLTDIYGDYMQVPPEDKRAIHASFYIDKLV